ncbi:MAG: hypothetical protein AAFU03_17540, partial [Bacteroidota bacterium]
MAKHYILLISLLLVGFLSAQDQLVFPVVENNDDMEEYLAGGSEPEGTLDASSSDLELGLEIRDGNPNPQLVGIRFQGVTLDGDTEILGAYIQFTVDETSPEEPASFTIRAQADPNPDGFNGSDVGNISSRPTFATTVAWDDVPTWPFVGAAGEDQRTADLTPLLMEVFAQDGWVAGNSIVFTIEGTGMRTAESRNSGEDVAARLVVLVPEPTTVGLQGCEPTPVPEGNREFELSPIGTYSTGVFDGSAAEIVAYDPDNQVLFFTNGDDNSVGILDVSNPSSPSLVTTVDMSPFGGGVNSIVYCSTFGVAAASVQGNNVDDNGSIIFINSIGGIGTFTPETGVLPDMIAESPDGSFLVTANEGEPSDDYSIDPLGSVTIVN